VHRLLARTAAYGGEVPRSSSTRSSGARPASRSGGATARSGAPARGKGGSTGRGQGGRSTSGRGATSRTATTKPIPAARGRSAPARRGGAGRVLLGLLLLPGRAVGSLVRSVHRSTAELDPAHRRDGAGFLLLAAAAVVAAGEWFSLDGVVIEAVHWVTAGALGRAALALPLVLLALSLRLFRRPDDEHANGRIGIGLVAVGAACAGVLQVAAGLPSPPEGAERLQSGGGVVGFVVANPLEAAVSVWLCSS
jgi:S-DNA-T family DNA segregation ATPase FtsK/SpoIIIE